jgi:hypothetical protein
MEEERASCAEQQQNNERWTLAWLGRRRLRL